MFDISKLARIPKTANTFEAPEIVGSI